MDLFSKSSLIAAVVEGVDITRLALLKKRGESWEIEKLEELPKNVNPLDIIPKEAMLVTTIPAHEVLIRPLHLPVQKEKEIERVLPFQAEPLLPYPIEQAVLRYQKIKENKENSLLTLFAVKKDHLKRHLTASPLSEFVTSTPQALAALLPKTTGFSLFLYLYGHEGHFLLIQEGALVTVRSFEREKSEIERAIRSLLASYPNLHCDSIHLLSDASTDAAMIEKMSGKKVVSPTLSQDTPPAFAIAIGAALAASQTKGISFREISTPSPRLIKRLQKPLFLALSLSCALWITLFALEKKVLENQERELILSAQPALSSVTSKEELYLKLEEAEALLAKESAGFALLPGVPSVRDTLAWISSHRALRNENGESTIEIEDFHYVMVSRPQFERKNDRYQIRVELTFTTDSPTSAHKFHEALQTPNPFVDGKKEVEWMNAKGKYRTIFYLKDKTGYQ